MIHHPHIRGVCRLLALVSALLLAAPAAHGEGRYRAGVENALQQLDAASAFYQQGNTEAVYQHLESIKVFAAQMDQETQQLLDVASREQAHCLGMITQLSGAVDGFKSKSIDADKAKGAAAGNLFSRLGQQFKWEEDLAGANYELQLKQRELNDLEDMNSHFFGKIVLLFENKGGRIVTLKDDIGLLNGKINRLAGMIAESEKENEVLKNEMEAADKKYRKYTYMYNVLHEKNGELKAVNDFLNKSMAFWSRLRTLSQDHVADQFFHLNVLLNVESASPGKATTTTARRMGHLRQAMLDLGDRLDAGENFMQAYRCQ